MRAISPPFLLLLLSVPALTAADIQPLSVAAKAMAKNIPQGAIVTAEKKSGAVSYGGAGKLEPAGTPPERIIFEIGSITKVFTALLLAQAVIEKKITLETTLQQALGAKQEFADPRVGAITMVQLATHTSGLPRLPDNLKDAGPPVDPYSKYDRAKLSAYLSGAKLSADPPFSQSYSNLGMGLLGDILSRIYRKPWADLVAEKITRPLGMPDTAATLGEALKPRFAPAYKGAKAVKPWTFAALAGAGALRSTATDLVTFGEAMLHPEKTPLAEAFALVTKPHTGTQDIGLAVMISKLDGRTVLEHNGATGGYGSLWQVEPETGAIRVILTNNAQMSGEKVIAAARNEKPRLIESGKMLTQEQLTGYEGVYRIGPKARFTILRRDDQLWTQLTGQAFLRLFPHESADRFFLKAAAAEMQFNRESGKVVAVTNFQNGRELTAKRTADPVPQIRFRGAKELAEYAGTYELAPKQTFTLKVQGVTLFAQLTGQPFLPVLEKRDGWFEYDTVDAALEFERNDDGKIVALNLHQHGAVQRAAKKP